MARASGQILTHMPRNSLELLKMDVGQFFLIRCPADAVVAASVPAPAVSGLVCLCNPSDNAMTLLNIGLP